MFFAIKTALLTLALFASSQAMRMPRPAAVSLATRNARTFVPRQLIGGRTELEAADVNQACQADCAATIADSQRANLNPQTKNNCEDDLTCICTDKSLDNLATCLQCVIDDVPDDDIAAKEILTDDSNVILADIVRACEANDIVIAPIELILEDVEDVPPPPPAEQAPSPPPTKNDAPPPPKHEVPPPPKHGAPPPPKHEAPPHVDECLVTKSELDGGKFILIRV
ncbi:hypothetical protein BDV98DRAFT_659735 [Pterulicium gracile]|uniref:Extracellular membrane protein CFEM domain-containing protein n=1 Tax=Pterulicium gracile TaxID=1884261 RepID=A0A5C3Q009_9AGAR|nr:hypothetical protein BDV98DRAFT_659735 [Pterula gracilis]